MRIEDLVALTLEEDIAFGDITTRLTVPAGTEAEAGIIAKAEGVLAGIDVAGEVFQQVDPSLDYIPLLVEGSDLVYGSVIARLQGPAAAILTAERTALNFLQHLSGIATLTRAYVRVSGGRIGILDTRKTTPETLT